MERHCYRLLSSAAVSVFLTPSLAEKSGQYRKLSQSLRRPMSPAYLHNAPGYGQIRSKEQNFFEDFLGIEDLCHLAVDASGSSLIRFRRKLGLVGFAAEEMRNKCLRMLLRRGALAEPGAAHMARSGIMSVKVEPLPGSESTSILPICS